MARAGWRFNRPCPDALWSAPTPGLQQEHRHSRTSTKQSASIAQVNQAVTRMDHATQQNAALVEEAAAAAQSMQEQSAKLGALVAVSQLA